MLKAVLKCGIKTCFRNWSWLSVHAEGCQCKVKYEAVQLDFEFLCTLSYHLAFGVCGVSEDYEYLLDIQVANCRRLDSLAMHSSRGCMSVV